jgi:serine/threonine protein kinase
MGVVYRARDTRLDRIVAVKLLARDKGADPVRKQRFFQEARAASALNHPNIVTIYESAVEGETDYLVMEYVRGKTLDQIIPSRRLPVGTMLQYAIQFADALATAHGSGIIHRDIKPSNLMVSEEGRVKVLDFGLAKLAEQTAPGEEDSTRTILHQSQEGTVVGSAPYMSPEQAEGKVVDGRSDIFSLGAVLYEMCTGRRAFSGESRASTLAAVITKDPAPIEQAAPHTPAEVQRLILHCLHKEPNRRFQSMLDVKLTLEELKVEYDAGRLTGLRPPASASVRASQLVVAIGAALFTVTAVGSWLWWRFHRELPTRPLSVEQLTFDSGLTTDPAISPDGKLIAYASDRAGEGNLDIWVQYRGGEPVRITHQPADEDQPTFSPDGTQIAYRSAQDGGGIYLVSSLGGGEPRLIAAGFGRPRFSPDGAEILFSFVSPGATLAYTINVVSPSATRKRLAPEFSWASTPVWSPDGRYLMFLGARPGGNQVQAGLWVIPRDDGVAEQVQLDRASLPPELREPSLDAWLPRDRILGELEIRGRTHLWQGRLRRNRGVWSGSSRSRSEQGQPKARPWRQMERRSFPMRRPIWTFGVCLSMLHRVKSQASRSGSHRMWPAKHSRRSRPMV